MYICDINQRSQVFQQQHFGSSWYWYIVWLPTRLLKFSQKSRIALRFTEFGAGNVSLTSSLGLIIIVANISVVKVRRCEVGGE